jgi:hypothetical protein
MKEFVRCKLDNRRSVMGGCCVAARKQQMLSVKFVGD